MDMSTLEATARQMVAPGKGILAADESAGTIAKRFEAGKIADNEENRRRYRQLFFTTPGVAQFVSGVILFEETLGQSADDGTSFVDVLSRQGIVPGIKVDKGSKPLAGSPGEQVTEGLDGLRERLADYGKRGARFAKWRAVIVIDGDRTPTARGLQANAHALARYAALCQEASIVPIVEPEVLMDGEHSIERCAEVTEAALQVVFDALWKERVVLEGIVLKPNMVIAGKKSPRQASVKEVAEATVRCLRRTVPAAVPGIAFLSGGQSDEQATANLDAINRLGPLPWQLTFSYGRALQSAALQTWRGEPAKMAEAQKAFLHRARCNGAARNGAYTPELERSRG